MAKLKAKKKKKKTDKVYYDIDHNEDFTGKNLETITRKDNKGLIKGRQDVQKSGAFSKGKHTYKQVKLGAIEYRKSTSAGNVRKKGGKVGTERKAKKHTSISVFGKDIYNKKKEMDPEKADKRYDKMRKKLIAKKRKQKKKKEEE